MSGNLLEDISPPIIPPKEIDDAQDSKPEDWDERERIPDPDATKPDDWDETAPAKITDSRYRMVSPDIDRDLISKSYLKNTNKNFRVSNFIFLPK